MISANFHLFTPHSFSTLPTHLVRRILHRVAAERNYDFTPTPRVPTTLSTVTNGDTFKSMSEICNDFEAQEINDGPSHTPRPDAATLWTYSATVDPELHLPNDSYLNLASDHVLSLPIDRTLQTIPPQAGSSTSSHPLVELPKIFDDHHKAKATNEDSQASPITSPSLSSISSRSAIRFQLLTTLHIDGISGNVDDISLQNLKWCTHLTALWTRKCNITDYGVRLLASSLELPGPIIHASTSSQSSSVSAEGRGLRRLRAWFLPGCYKVTDKSLKSFARWPGLVLLGRGSDLDRRSNVD